MNPMLPARIKWRWWGLVGLAAVGALAVGVHLKFRRPHNSRPFGGDWVTRHVPPLPESEGEDERPFRERSQRLDPTKSGIGRWIEDLAFEDLQGKEGKLSDFASKKALAIVIRDVGCPVSQRYGPEVARIDAEYSDQVGFLYVNLSEQDTEEKAAAEVEKYGFKGRYALDPEGTFGRALGVRTTTDVFVLDRARTLVYRGAVDDRIGRGVVRPEARERFLRDALDAVVEGFQPPVIATSAPGCVLAFDPVDEAPVDAAVTYHRDIGRIVQQRCERCHRDGGAAPFALSDYKEVEGRAAMIEFVLENDIMPPWFAADGTGPWANDPRPTPEETAALLAWIEDDCPEGDPKEGRVPPRWPEGWLIGEPDYVLTMKEPIHVPADGYLDYQRVFLDEIEEDMWITAVEVRPEFPAVVHHAGVMFSYKGASWNMLEGLVPGKPPTVYPEGYAKFLPKGARVRLDLHYTPNGTAVDDRTSVGFLVSETPPRYEVFGDFLQKPWFQVPAGARDFEVSEEFTFPEDVEIRHFVPHMHLRGKTFLVEAFPPDGSRMELLRLTSWDPDWQWPYFYEEPVRLPAGTLIRATGRFDNSADNPFNPDPTMVVDRGDQIWDEMMGVFIDWTLP